MIRLSAAASAGSGGIAVAIVLVILVVAAIALYWIPTVIAYFRHVPDIGSVVVINALLGWTLIGWIVALALAMRTAAAKPRAVIYGNDYIQAGGWPQAAPGQAGLAQTVPGQTRPGHGVPGQAEPGQTVPEQGRLWPNRVSRGDQEPTQPGWPTQPRWPGQQG